MSKYHAENVSITLIKNSRYAF